VEITAREAALAAMDVEGLRDLIREMIPLARRNDSRLVDSLVDRAARSRSGWIPAGPTHDSVGEILSSPERPSGSDMPIRPWWTTTCGKARTRSWQGLPIRISDLPGVAGPLGNGDVDIGQHETLDEVLSVDGAACAAEYVISMYMTATPSKRGKAVLSAIDEVRGIGHFGQPLRDAAPGTCMA
jgi:hypothetical protein